jgi:carbonic anhydrase/acetyltransferase-like protein (isoleucine patch superfamily)
VLDECEIGRDCLIAAGAVVPPGTRVPDGSVVMGVPGKVVRQIQAKEKRYIEHVLTSYLQLAEDYAAGKFADFRSRYEAPPADG